MTDTPKLRRFVLIEKHLDIIWGEVVAADPVEACRKCDEALETFGCCYTPVDADHFKTDNLCSALEVHEVPADMEWLGVDDDHDPGEIALVKMLPLVAHIHVQEPEYDR